MTLFSLINNETQPPFSSDGNHESTTICDVGSGATVVTEKVDPETRFNLELAGTKLPIHRVEHGKPVAPAVFIRRKPRNMRRVVGK